MTNPFTRRIRDPIHGLIRFNGDDETDKLAWKLIDTPGFQRLRRIKQLGFSEFVFPGATHTRFAHCVGVFSNARYLLKIIEREVGHDINEYRALVSLMAALLHDVGHGPFSHAFESAQSNRGIEKNHERWSADIILSEEAGIKTVLDQAGHGEKLAQDIADLLVSETPIDIYHAVVSSSFDADRLDYLRRDRLMTGSGAGAIDFDWLMDNVRVADIHLGVDDDDDGSIVQSFCLDAKAIQAAETFLLARYHLYDQVYLHKSTRGLELLLSACLGEIYDYVSRGRWDNVNLTENDPLVVFLQQADPTVRQYLELDDFVIWNALERVIAGESERLSDLASRILFRRLPKCLDVEKLFLTSAHDPMEISRRAREYAKDQLDKTVFMDSPKISIYGSVKEDDARIHKRLSISFDDNVRKEITKVSKSIEVLESPRKLLRLYFLDPAERDKARDFALAAA